MAIFHFNLNFGSDGKPNPPLPPQPRTTQLPGIMNTFSLLVRVKTVSVCGELRKEARAAKYGTAQQALNNLILALDEAL